MLTLKNTIWERISSIPKDTDKKRANELAGNFIEKGYLGIAPTKILNENKNTFLAFYKILAEHKGYINNIPSPAEQYCDSSWMLEADFCFINIRALSKSRSKTGKISDAMKVLPAVRASSFHLAPFFDCAMDNIYAVDSLNTISPDIVDKDFLDYGLSPKEQMQMFIDAVHILGKTAGFDLEPHTSQFSRVVLSAPEHFRWLKLSSDKQSLYGNVSQEIMLENEIQGKLVEEVRKIVSDILLYHQISHIEDLSRGYETIRECHRSITNKLISEGYWTLPTHTWGGVGLPQFSRYNYDGNYPEFIYLDKNSQDQSMHSFGMLTPFALYGNLPINKEPVKPPSFHKKTISFLQNIFPSVVNDYKFDYVRFDYVDHIFDSTVDNSDDTPVSDRMTPKILRDIISKAKEERPYIGAMAERMGQDAEIYAKLGFDLILGQDMICTMNIDYLSCCIEIQKNLESLSDSGELTKPCSMLFAVDTHDSGHPLFWKKPLSDVVGERGIALRHFLSRFLYAGKLKRPKYECIGNQDLSSGLYKANNKKVSLKWKGNINYCANYHMLEDIYDSLREEIKNARMEPVQFCSNVFVWSLTSDKKTLICFADLERNERSKKKLKADDYTNDFSINISELSKKSSNVYYIDIQTGIYSKINIDKDNESLNISNVAPLECGIIVFEH